jgi:dienelactone hydrolase
MRFLLPCALLWLGTVARADERKPEKGTFRFVPSGDQSEVPERYRLAERSFDFELTPTYDMPTLGIDVYRLKYPSPHESPHKENNTVYAEYYRPVGKGPFPAVIVLDITGGDQSLSRMMCTQLASKGVAGLFVQMAYYGPRRPPGSSLRLMSPNLTHTLAAVRQTVLDLRCAAAWLEGRPEVDGKRLGILGTSLGSFMAALTAEMEPKLNRCVVLLGGGGFVDGYWDHPQALPYRKAYEALGGTKQKVKDILAPLDPMTCAANLKNRRFLMMAAKNDEIVPPKMAEALWMASGQQKILWFDAGHYTALAYLPVALDNIVAHFKAE